MSIISSDISWVTILAVLNRKKIRRCSKVSTNARCLYNKVGFQWHFYVSCFFPSRKISATMGARAAVAKWQKSSHNWGLTGAVACYMAVLSNSPIDDNILKYLALRSLLLHNYFLSFDTCKHLTFCHWD
jgi:hypothetical protein